MQRNDPDTVYYAYDETATPKIRVLTDPEKEEIIANDIFNEEITDILGQTLGDVGAVLPSVTMIDMTVDKYNRTVYYIDATIGFSRFVDRYVVTRWWAFQDHANDHYNWNNKTPLQPEDADDLFYRTKASTIIYQYPSHEAKKAYTVPTGHTVILLNDSPEFDGKTDPWFTDWRYILYEHDYTYTVGYINIANLDDVGKANYQITELSSSQAKAESVNFAPLKETITRYYGRVIRYEIPIYKYPTCFTPITGTPLIVGKALKTKENGDNALPLYYLVKITDALYWHYFAVDVYDPLQPDANGNPTKIGIGFVPTNGIIDIEAESEYPRVVPNAEIVADDEEVVIIYRNADGTNPIGEITLKNGSAIRIDQGSNSDYKYKKTAKYNHIYYNDPEIGQWWLIEGYVETKYIKPKELNLTLAQWIGLSMLASLVVGVLVAFIVIAIQRSSYEKRKKQIAEQELEPTE
jgi:hypothetical protein